MKIKLDEVIKTIDGDVYTNGDKAGSPPFTMKNVMEIALKTEYPTEAGKIGLPEKMSRYELAKKLKEVETEIDLPVEDIAKIKALIGMRFPVEIVGYACTLIEKSGGK